MLNRDWSFVPVIPHSMGEGKRHALYNVVRDSLKLQSESGEMAPQLKAHTALE